MHLHKCLKHTLMSNNSTLDASISYEQFCNGLKASHICLNKYTLNLDNIHLHILP